MAPLKRCQFTFPVVYGQSGCRRESRDVNKTSLLAGYGSPE